MLAIPTPANRLASASASEASSGSGNGWEGQGKVGRLDYTPEKSHDLKPTSLRGGFGWFK